MGADVGAGHLLGRLMTLIELWARARPETDLPDRRSRPWDRQPRRPNRADKRNS